MDYISILRGINVGGKRKILMADLKKMYEGMEFERVQTYIQSGNVFFTTSKKVSKGELEQQLEKQIEKTFGYDVPVIVKTREELGRAIQINPFLKEADFEEEKLYVIFLQKKPLEEHLNTLKEIPVSADRFVVEEEFIFIYYAEKISNSKLTNNYFEKKLKVIATTRNWKTMVKLMLLP